MAFFDMPPEKLVTYRAAEAAPRDFDSFWQRTLKDTGAFPLAPKFERLNDPIYDLIDVYDVTFNGVGGQQVKCWFIEPTRKHGDRTKRPCIVTYIGYGGGRSLPVDHITYAMAGFANL